MSVPLVINPPPGLDPTLGEGCSEVTLLLHPAVAAVVREALAAETTATGWSEADAAAMELVIAAIEANGIRGGL